MNQPMGLTIPLSMLAQADQVIEYATVVRTAWVDAYA
jgi:hypothetical protein